MQSSALSNKVIPNISLQYLLGSLFCAVALMPWVNFSINDLDSQPWPILFGLAFLISCSPTIKAPRYTLIVFYFILIGFLVSIANSENFGAFIIIRAAINYFGLLAIFLAFYNYLYRYGFPWRIFASVNLVWLIFAGIEVIIPEIVETISKRRTTLDRGVTSLVFDT